MAAVNRAASEGVIPCRAPGRVGRAPSAKMSPWSSAVVALCTNRDRVGAHCHALAGLIKVFSKDDILGVFFT